MKVKVSNVCQLGDKQKYNASETKSGITFTNNGDGTITVNGTSTRIVEFNLQFINFIKNHTYLLIGCPSGGSTSTYILDTGAGIGNDTGNGTISKPIFPGNKYFSIYVYANTTCNNIVFKPQLFDLTEMYGVGNEPTTVAQFRQDFPEEMYEYSPECWKRCKELRYVTDKYGVVDLGTLTWNKYVNNSNWLFYATIPNGRTNVGIGNKVKAFIDKYKYDDTALNGSAAVIKNSPFVCWDATQSQILIKDTDYTNANVFKSSLAGVKLYYELKTPSIGYLPLRTGKYRIDTRNLFDINANSEKGYYDEQGNFYPNDRFLCFTIDAISNNTYCISTSKLGAVKGIVSFWNNNTFVSAVNYGEQTAFAYTVPSGANKLKFVIEANQKYSNIQIELGTTATSYQPYKHISFH